MQAVAELVSNGRNELKKAIVGQEEVVEQCFLALLCGGHVLLEGVPGIAKTLVVKTFAQFLRLTFQRVQCTSDLMPADILGGNILNMATSTFQLHHGPIFTDLLLVDEINRMPPRTQAALLEAMEERQVTIDVNRHQLADTFTVFATQNPVEFEGTYPLPEAQLDRFLMKISIGYPEFDQEIQILQKHHLGFSARDMQDIGVVPIDTALLSRAREEVKAVQVQPALFNYITQLVRRTRDSNSLSLGASPRAALSLMYVAKASAAVDGRDYLIPDDVKSACFPVLRHRIMLRPEAQLEGVSADQVIRDVVGSVEVPK